MKLRFSTSLAAISFVAADYNVTLVTESNSSAVSGQSLVPLHEGAGFNFLFFSGAGAGRQYAPGSTFLYSEETHSVYQPVEVGTVNGVETEKWNLTVAPGSSAISVGVLGGTLLQVADSYLTVNGSSKFYAAKNTTVDVYGYSKNDYQLLTGGQSDAIPVKVKVVAVSNSTNTSINNSASTSSGVPPVANGAAVVGFGSTVVVVAVVGMLL